jgi:hypothetical protein
METRVTANKPFFGGLRIVTPLMIVMVFAVGIGIRLLKPTNPPLDFHAWRQLRAASIARGMYYEMLPSADPQVRERAIALGQGFEVLEPRIFEQIVALTYRLVGAEKLWFARLYAILFWSMGGVGVFLLARRLTSLDGALTATVFYLWLPYGVTASRSFQPDPFMVMWLIWAAYGLYEWSQRRSWAWAIAAAICSGMAVLAKVFAVYPMAIMAVLVVLSTWGLRRAICNVQVWAVAVIMIGIPGVYYLLGVGGLAPSYISSWVLQFSNLWFSPRFYTSWLKMIDSLCGLAFVFSGLAATFLLPRPGRVMLWGLWAGYAVFGLSVPSLIITHDYYNLPLIPIVALSLAPLGDLFLSKASQQPRYVKITLAAIILLSIGYPAWLARNAVVAVDYTLEARGWEKMGRELPQDGTMIGLTHDYDTRLCYYGWTKVYHWPYTLDEEKMTALAGGNADMNDPVWERIFRERTEGYSYFLVTLRGELEAQPVLKRILFTYPYRDEGEYILFDLRQK